MVQTTEPHYEFNAGSLALNFANTVWERPGFLTDSPAPPHELLNSFGEFATWAQASGAVSPKQRREIERAAAQDMAKAERALKQVLKLRETIFRTVLDLTRKRRGNGSALLTAINEFISALPPQRLELDGDGVVCAETVSPEDVSLIQVMICRDFMRLLCAGNQSRLRVCAADDCGWVFLDTSKSGKRKWCTMSDCGNRDKVMRFLERQRNR